MASILLVEGDRTLSDGIVLALERDGHFFTQCYERKSAVGQIWKRSFDLVILDINLPDGSGYSLLSKLREFSDVPVLMLTANDLEREEVLGLSMGAADYVTKPFSLLILRTRVNVLLRRKPVPKQDVFETGEYLFDFHRMYYLIHGKEIMLNRTEQRLLHLLVKNKGQILTRQQLLESVWEDAADSVEENALSVAMNRLRHKVEEDACRPSFIQTVYGIGYVWREE